MDGKASENRDKSEDLPDNLIFKAFGKKSAESFMIPLFKIPIGLEL